MLSAGHEEASATLWTAQGDSHMPGGHGLLLGAEDQMNKQMVARP